MPSTSSPISSPPRLFRKLQHSTASPTWTRWPHNLPSTSLANKRFRTPPPTINGAQARHLQSKYQLRPLRTSPCSPITKPQQPPTFHQQPTLSLQHRHQPWHPQSPHLSRPTNYQPPTAPTIYWPHSSRPTHLDNPRPCTPPTTINGAPAHHPQLQYQPRPHWTPPSTRSPPSPNSSPQLINCQLPTSNIIATRFMSSTNCTTHGTHSPRPRHQLLFHLRQQYQISPPQRAPYRPL